MLVLLLPSKAFSHTAEVHWQSVYHHGPNGKTISGNKEKLFEAVRKGQQIRIYMKLKTVEHSMDANFITIFENEIYAQIDQIKGQKPNKSTKLLELRANEFNGLYSTNGLYELNWFVHH